MRGLLGTASVLALTLSAPALAQDVDASAAPAVAAAGRQVYAPADFDRFAPSNARDMLSQVPGFTLRTEDQTRGLGEATANVLINGERITSKSEGIDTQLGRISIARVVRIEIVDGATLGIPGLSGQVANVITRPSAISGRFDYRATWRPRFAKAGWFAGEASVSGTRGPIEWTLALNNNNSGRGGAGGPGWIFDGAHQVSEHRTILVHNESDNPRLAGKVKWDGPGSTVANLNASYTENYSSGSNDENRDLVVGVDQFRDFDSRFRGYAQELGGDIDVRMGPGRLKLIGLDRFSHGDGQSDSVLIFDDLSPSTGSRFVTRTNSGERIGRAEYRWSLWGGDWQLSGEAAFNRFEQVAHLFSLDPAGGRIETPFPGSTGGVTEDRYESILTHNRTLAKGLTVQISAGAEYSKLSQTGAGGLEREFTRPKGSLTLAWTPQAGADVSLKLARTVGQLSFSDFLASVNLAQNTGNAGNVHLVPPQAWEADIQYKKNLNAWGSTNLRFYGRWIDDFIDIIPIGSLESRGNVDGRATLYGVSTTTTINLDPLGWKGAKININGVVETSNLKDPLTGRERPFSGHRDYGGEFNLRYDVPQSDWAMGGGFQWTHVKPNVRLFEVNTSYEGPMYNFAFIENKDVHGLTVNLNVFNLTNGQVFFDRTAFTGLRDRMPIAFFEKQRLPVSHIFQIRVKGAF
ncbi:MAG TPA: TonB-dependent receptor plug domain-containing protein [Caulobacteraceae bacterium]|nr:TonB-dependent receptor plug domain-containing protein [Caulobacteraceae bacterium]